MLKFNLSDMREVTAPVAGVAAGLWDTFQVEHAISFANFTGGVAYVKMYDSAESFTAEGAASRDNWDFAYATGSGQLLSLFNMGWYTKYTPSVRPRFMSVFLDSDALDLDKFGVNFE
jgi:hypothetical protein